jgi:hypothetical protein
MDEQPVDRASKYHEILGVEPGKVLSRRDKQHARLLLAENGRKRKSPPQSRQQSASPEVKHVPLGGKRCFWDDDYLEFELNNPTGPDHEAKFVQRKLYRVLHNAYPFHTTKTANDAYPLHVGDTPLIDLDAFVARAEKLPGFAKKPLSRLRSLLRSINDPAYLEKLRGGEDQFANRRSTFTPEEAALLVKHGMAVSCAPSEIKCTLVGFKNFEPPKGRNRAITHTEQLNAAMQEEGYSGKDMNLPSPWDVQSLLHHGTHGVAFDLTRSFYQLAIHPSCRCYFGFIDSAGNAYMFARLPMGFVPAAEIMHCIVLLTVSMTLQDMGVLCEDSSKCPLQIAVYIDNVLAVGSLEFCSSFATHFVAACETLHITLNKEPSNHPSTRIPFCGQILDLVAKTASLGPKSIAKLNELSTWSQQIDPTTPITMETFAATIGVLLFATRVLRVRPGNFYYLLKCYRRRCASCSDQRDSTTLWLCAITDLRRWIKLLLGTTAVNVPKSDSSTSWVLISDASKSGCGALLFDPVGNVLVYQHRWTGKHARMHINEQEAIAVSLAAEHFAPVVGNAPAILFVDNSSVSSSVTNGMSRNFFINIVTQAPINFTAVTLLKSKDNPADPISRFRPLDPNFNWNEFWINLGRTTSVEWSANPLTRSPSVRQTAKN